MNTCLDYVLQILSAICTLAAVVVAVWQTNRANKQADKANELSSKLMNLELKSKIGYFLPQDKMSAGDIVIPYPYDLSKTLPLNNCGDDFANLLKTKFKINHLRSVICDTQFFAPEKGEFTRLDLDLGLTNAELACQNIDVEVALVMENSRGYRYRQTLCLAFSKNNGGYLLSKFNTSIEDAK